MARLFQALVLGLVGAGIVHIAILLLIPLFSERDAWSQAMAAGAVNQFVGLADVRAPGYPTDPLIESAVCRFDLSIGPLRATAPGRVPFWSLSIFDRQGRSQFSLSDRTAADGRFDVVVLTPLQLIELRKDMPAEFEGSIFIELDLDEGMIVVRSLVPDESWRRQVGRWLEGAACEPV